jgi:aminoglycoside N3'-acetyltransferase
MKNLTQKINHHLKKLNIKKNDNLIVHSNIIPFGIYNVSLPKHIINCLLKIIGDSGSLAMPLYNLGLSNKDIINLDKDYNKKENSILSKYYFDNYKVVKSSSIFHSHILLGPLEKEFKLREVFNSYGKNSDFNFFLKKKFKLILLGCDASEGCTYLHYVEFKTKNFFRIKKYFNFTIKKSSKIYKKKIAYLVRKKNIFLNLNNVFFHPEVSKKTKIATLKYGKSFSIQLDDLDSISQKLLLKNPKLILK